MSAERKPLATPPTDLAGRVFDADGKRYAVLWFSQRDARHLALTAAEREVAVLLVAGQTNAEIAQRRGTAPRTVANQVASIFEKLGVGSRGELVARFSGVEWL